jgi:perosamine synthetase
MLRLIPPAGAPITVRQVMRAVVKASLARGRSDQALEAFATRFEVRHVFALSSGRAGLWAILQALHRLQPERNVVAVPAYICFSVPASIARAGLKLVPVDIDPRTLDVNFANLEAVPEDGLLCVISSNLFGLANDLPRIQRVARAKQAFVIEDAAQGLGAMSNGRYIGTQGDVGLYSLGRGKALTTLEGGIVVTSSGEIAEALRAVASHLLDPPFFHDASLFLRLLAYAVLLNPQLYWIPNSLPFLRLGVTEFDPAFRVSNLPDLCKALLAELMGQLDSINQIRRENAQFLSAALAGNARFVIPIPAASSQGIFTRMPIVAIDEATRDSALQKLRAAGIAASSFYPSAICDIPEIGEHMASPDYHCRDAEALARRLLTLPTHPLVTQQDRRRMVEVLSRL